MSTHQHIGEAAVRESGRARRFRCASYISVVSVLFFFAGQHPFQCKNRSGSCTPFKDSIQIDSLRQKTNDPTKKRLEFVHIPKTGGTAIESIAKNANLTWAICHFGSPDSVSKISNGLVGCYNQKESDDAETINTNQTKDKNNNWRSGLFWESNGCPWWHVPPSHVQAFYSERNNPYADADLFAVVRNPYERIISEYYYVINELEGHSANKSTTQDAVHFNKILHDRLSEFSSKMWQGEPSKGIPGNKMYYSHDGHLISQYDYIYDKETSQRIVEHVLFFEDLNSDFSNLMADYNLPLALPSNRVRPKSEQKLGVGNLTIQNILLIEELYEEDFREFGYEVLSKRRRRKTR